MKYIWEESDLKNNWGCYVMINEKTAKDDGHLGLTKTWKIGGDSINPAMICMGDGLVIRYKNKLELINHLNKDCGYRPVRKEELLEMISNSWHYHEGIPKLNIKIVKE